jgi:hypothetical protein
MNLQDFAMSLQEMNLGSHLITNPVSAMPKHTRKCRQGLNQQFPDEKIWWRDCHWGETSDHRYSPDERKFNQDYFLAFIAPELAKEDATATRRADTKQLVVDGDKSMSHNRGKIQAYFARKK